MHCRGWSGCSWLAQEETSPKSDALFSLSGCSVRSQRSVRWELALRPLNPRTLTLEPPMGSRWTSRLKSLPGDFQWTGLCSGIVGSAMRHSRVRRTRPRASLSCSQEQKRRRKQEVRAVCSSSNVYIVYVGMRM